MKRICIKIWQSQKVIKIFVLQYDKREVYTNYTQTISIDVWKSGFFSVYKKESPRKETGITNAYTFL